MIKTYTKVWLSKIVWCTPKTIAERIKRNDKRYIAIEVITQSRKTPLYALRSDIEKKLQENTEKSVESLAIWENNNIV